MFKWFMKLIGKAPIMTTAEIMAPLKKQHDALKLNEALRKADKAKKVKAIAALTVANACHDVELKQSEAIRAQLDSVLNPKAKA